MPTRVCFGPEFGRDARQGGLPAPSSKNYRIALRDVLEHAIRFGGSSVSDYVDAEGVRWIFSGWNMSLPAHR